MQRSFWIESDGNTVPAVLHARQALTPLINVAIWVAFDGYQSKPGFRLSASSLAEIIEAELGVAVELRIDHPDLSAGTRRITRERSRRLLQRIRADATLRGPDNDDRIEFSGRAHGNSACGSIAASSAAALFICA